MLQAGDTDDSECSALNTVLIRTTHKICIKWDPVRAFGVDRIHSLTDSDAEVKIFIHFTGAGISYKKEGPSTSGWGTVNVTSNSKFNVMDKEARIVPNLIPTDQKGYDSPPPSLIFIRVTAAMNGIEVFASTPMISFLPTIFSLGQNTDVVQRSTCDTLKDSNKNNIPAPPCPQNVNQAFFDTNLEVDPGCVEDSKAPFNCYTNPGAAKCFKVLRRYIIYIPSIIIIIQHTQFWLNMHWW